MSDYDSVELAARLDVLESKVDAILRMLGVTHPQGELDPHGMPEVMHLVHMGKTIKAIKAYREATGVGLKEAKAAIDAVTPQHR